MTNATLDPDWSSIPSPYPPEWSDPPLPFSPDWSDFPTLLSLDSNPDLKKQYYSSGSSPSSKRLGRNKKKVGKSECDAPCSKKGSEEGETLTKKYNDGYYNWRIGAPNDHNKLRLQDAAERDKVDKFKLGDYGGKLTCVDYGGTHDAPIYWEDCPLGGYMTDIEKDINAKYRRRHY